MPTTMNLRSSKQASKMNKQAPKKKTPAAMYKMTLVAAMNLPQADLLSESDPYAVIDIDDGQHFTTPTVINDVNPVFNFEVHLKHSSKVDISIHIYDEDSIAKDKVLGSCTFNFAELGTGQHILNLDGAEGQIKILVERYRGVRAYKKRKATTAKNEPSTSSSKGTSKKSR